MDNIIMVHTELLLAQMNNKETKKAKAAAQ
jgi:hypothetical protein